MSSSSDYESLRLELEAMKSRERRRGKALAVLSALLVSGLVIRGVAQNEDLTVFQAGSPARASDVNGNFRLLKKWIEAKVGSVTSSGVEATARATLRELEVRGNARFVDNAIFHEEVTMEDKLVSNGGGQNGNLSVSGGSLSASKDVRVVPGSGSHIRLEGPVRMDSNRAPILIKSSGSFASNWDTGISTAHYNCVLAGWYMGEGDIFEGGVTKIGRAFTYVSGSTWRVSMDFTSHKGDEKHAARVLCVSKRLSEWSGATTLSNPGKL